ncbi:MAG: hypothetical protein KGL39_39075, partial [Patescibacteria group bacterium]|nr:hypothetical protein [Patescibacteria group bacterium]
PPGVLTNKTKAVKIAQDIAERDYGMTDMRSGSRPGDIAALAPSPIQTAEAESITRAFVEAGAPAEIAPELKKQAENFWQPAAGAAGTAMQAASAGAAEARKMGSDPVGLLHAAGKKGMLGPKYDVIARDTIKPK